MLEVLTLNGKPIILEKNKDGKYEITKEELNEIVNQAYAAGQKLITIPGIATPQTPINPPIYPDSPFWYDKNKIYCWGQSTEPIKTSDTKLSGSTDNSYNLKVDTCFTDNKD